MELLPPQTSGEYYVSFLGITDEVKCKVYKHLNWWMKNVNVVPVLGFNNINKRYEVGLNKPWSLHAFMTDQLTANTFKEFHQLSKDLMAKSKTYAYTDEGDAMMTNTNAMGNEDLLLQKFEDDQFPDLMKPKKSKTADNSNGQKSKMKRSNIEILLQTKIWKSKAQMTVLMRPVQFDCTVLWFWEATMANTPQPLWLQWETKMK